jgi:hypothetical protein
MWCLLDGTSGAQALAEAAAAVGQKLTLRYQVLFWVQLCSWFGVFFLFICTSA